MCIQLGSTTKLAPLAEELWIENNNENLNFRSPTFHKQKVFFTPTKITMSAPTKRRHSPQLKIKTIRTI